LEDVTVVEFNYFSDNAKEKGRECLCGVAQITERLAGGKEEQDVCLC
jgi:hypothetical protein